MAFTAAGKSTTTETEVVVVGAGLSGLAAATRLHEAGIKCVVLEARDRVGGKTHSLPLTAVNGHVELGAAWINDTNQVYASRLARKYKLETLVQNTEGNAVFQDADGSISHFPYGTLPKFSIEEQADVARVRDMFEVLCHTIDPVSPKQGDFDSMSVAEYLTTIHATPRAIATVGVWTGAMLGRSPKDISLLFFLHYCKSGGGLLQMRSDQYGGGQYLRFRTGTQSLSKGMAADLPKDWIHFNEPVLSIDQSREGYVTVSTSQGDYVARRVIVSIPTTVYKTIRFSPVLSASKQQISSATAFGNYTKVMLVFKEAFWLKHGLCGLVQSFAGPASVIRDTSNMPDGVYNLTCFVVSDLANAWSRLPKEERCQRLVEQVAAVHNQGAVAQVRDSLVEYVESDWANDEWAGYGCPCPSLPPGVMDKHNAALKSTEGRLHFVGTESADAWKGYMEGALRSGERGALEVLQSLGTRLSRL